MLKFPAPLGALLLSLSVGAWAQELKTLVIAPSQEVRAGARVVVEVVFLNISSREAPWSFPGALECRFIADQVVKTGTLELQPDGSPATTILAPNGFGRRNYELKVPPDLGGLVWVEIMAPGARKILLDVKPGEAPSPAELDEPRSSPMDMGRPGSRDPAVDATSAMDVFMQNIAPHEPVYFLAGLESHTAKFQVSFKYRLFGTNWAWAIRHPTRLENLYLGYTQTSIWDIRSASAPFVDSSYKPELLYLHEGVVGKDRTNRFRLDVQAGFRHESNGRDGADSRSLNIAYLQPRFTFGSETGLHFTLAPRVWHYTSDLFENPDLPRYRGHFSLRSTLGFNSGLQLASEVYVGDNLDRGKLEVDLTYPFPWWLESEHENHRSYTMYLHLQFFTGFGESLLFYRERETQIRVGLALFR